MAHAERRRGADAGLERLRQALAVAAVGAAVGVEDDRDLVGDALLGLADHDLAGAGRRPPHDAAQVVARHVLAHAVELEARRPRLRHRRADGRVLELAGQRAVGDELDARVHQQLERLGDDRLPLGEAERVAGDGDERADLVHAAPRAAQAVAVRAPSARRPAW